MDARDEASHRDQVVGVLQINRASREALENRHAESVKGNEGLTLECDRGTHRNIEIAQLARERVLLANLRIAPASRSIELNDQAITALDAHLINPILVAVQREDACITGVAKRLDGIDDEIGAQRRIRMLVWRDCNRRLSLFRQRYIAVGIALPVGQPAVIEAVNAKSLSGWVTACRLLEKTGKVRHCRHC